MWSCWSASIEACRPPRRIGAVKGLVDDWNVKKVLTKSSREWGPAELPTSRGRAYHLATAGKGDLVAELNRRGYAVAVITPQELIKAIEGADVPIRAEFDSSEWMAQYRTTLQKVMGKAALELVIAQLEADRPKNG